MLKAIKFKRKHRCFNIGDEISFRPGVNLLVGEQGCGKSTLLSVLRDAGKDFETISVDADKTNSRYLDFEKDNIRISPTWGSSKISIKIEAALRMSSHGQTNNAILKYLETEKDILFLIDEPDMALSIRSCYLLIERFKQAAINGCQIVASVHNPILIASQSEVLSLEHRKWMPSQEFIVAHSPAENRIVRSTGD